MRSLPVYMLLAVFSGPLAGASPHMNVLSAKKRDTSLSIGDWLTGGFVHHFEAANGTQGLALDGDYFYWGHHHGNPNDATIYKIGEADGSAVTNFAGPIHAHSGDIREDHGTLLFAGVDTTYDDFFEVWEISKTGTKLRAWDFLGEFAEDRGAAVYVDEDTIYMLDQIADLTLNIQEVTINDNGTFTLGPLWSSTPGFNLGTHQGTDIANGYVYYLTDIQQEGTKALYELRLNGDSTITINAQIDFTIPVELEGLTLSPDASEIYFGTIDHSVYRFIKSSEQSGSSYAAEVMTDNPLAVRNLTSAEELHDGTISAQHDIGDAAIAEVIYDEQAFTFETIVAINDMDSDGGLIGQWTSAKTSLLLWYDEGVAKNFRMAIDGGGATADTPTGYSVTRYQEYHVAVTYDGATIKLYIDGVERASVASAAFILPSQIFAAGDGDSRYLDGWTRGTAIYDSALSPARIAAHATASNPQDLTP